MCNKKDIDIIKISAEEIIIEFDNNEVENLIKKYKNKTIQINGRMVSKGFPKDNIPSKNASYIIFGKVDNNNSPFFTGNTIIQCYFDKVVVHNLNEGDMITVNCKFKVIKIGYKQMKYIVFHKGIIIDPAVENTAE
jgi:hypothetical protein